MGLLKKLLGGTASADEAVSALKNAAKTVMNEVEKVTGSNQPQAGVPNGTVISSNPAASPAPTVIPEQSGCSWGPHMPEEENQFSYPGTYREYFSELFDREFSGYTISKDIPESGNRLIYTFTKDGKKALVVEVLSQRSSVKKLRNDCRRQQIPYLRFYHDHNGWWNTRSYVIGRVKNALGES